MTSCRGSPPSWRRLSADHSSRSGKRGECKMDIGNGAVTLPRVDSLCRVCLAADRGERYDVFRADVGEPETTGGSGLLRKLQLHGGIEILRGDGLPAGICFRCVARVEEAHELYEQCQVADEKLRKLFGKPSARSSSNVGKFCKDQYCQTDVNFAASPLDEETSLSAVPENERFVRERDISRTDEVTEDEAETRTATALEDDKTETARTNKEAVPFRRDPYRTRKVSRFKRMTSMETLKNSKERQRQYIKSSAVASMQTNAESELPHGCAKCGKSYSSKKSLDRHALTHNNKKFKCPDCDKRFFRLDKLLEHNKSHRSKEKSQPVRCSICGKNFRKTDTMVRHLNVHKKANLEEVFAILKDIRDRRRSENGLGDFRDGRSAREDECATPKEEDRREEEIEAGKRLTSRVDELDCPADTSNCESNREDGDSDAFDDLTFYRCKHCAKCYSTKKSLQRHLLTHDEKKFACNICNMRFVRPDRLQSHRKRYGHDEDGACPEPQQPPDGRSAMRLINAWIREELDSDNEGKGFPCEVCGKSYVTKKSLLKHSANAHGSDEEYCAERPRDPEKRCEKEKPCACEECDKSFESEAKLRKHARMHERARERQDANFKRFLCHICSKTFRQNTGLMFHMRTHTGYKPHVCKYCGRGFTSNSNCINHERTHTGDRPFVCHFCSAAFAKSCTLKAHITTHTGEANYHCKTCGKSFRRLKYLKEHRFTHTGEKPYACKICGTAYSHSGSLFVHEKKCKAQYSGRPYAQSSQQTVSPHDAPHYCQPQTGVGSTPMIASLISINQYYNVMPGNVPQ